MERNTHNRNFTIVALAGIAAAAMIVLSGCNTTEGVGKDLESAGDAIADTARDAKN